MAPFLTRAITQLTTATPDALTITNPRGPTTNIDSEGGGSGAGGFSLKTSFGHGAPGTDNVLPGDAETLTPWWFSPTMWTGNNVLGQVREWPVDMALQRLQLLVEVDAASNTGGEYQIALTVDGSVIDCFVNVPIGASSGLRLTSSLDIYVGSTSKVGVRGSPGEAWSAGTLRCEVTVLGTPSAALGPFVSADLTRRQDASALVPFGGGDLTSWPNAGSAGSPLDWVPHPPDLAPAVTTESGRTFLQFEGVEYALQSNIPSGGEFTDPTPPANTMTPFWVIASARIRSSGGGLARYLISYSSRILDFPTTAHFDLVHQGNIGNIQTLSSVNGALIGKWCVLEWGFDGSAFFFRINGANVPLTVPGSFDGTAAITGSSMGAQFDPVHYDVEALYTYRVCPSAPEQAQTRDYFLTTYPPDA